MLELIVEHQAGIPLLMKPLDGNSSDGLACGQVLKDHIAHLHTAYGTTYLVAASALYSDENLPHLAQTPLQWITRVPATGSDTHAALAHAAPQAMQPLTAGYRYRALTSISGGVEQRGLLIASDLRPVQARRTVEQQRLKHSAQEINAWKHLCGTACAADAQQALERCAHGVQATYVHTNTVRAQPRYATRGHPGRDAPPDQGVYHVDGA